MPRHRLPEEEKKEPVRIRLPNWMIAKIKEKGTLQQVIEGILSKHIKK